MTNEPSWDAIFTSQPGAEGSDEARATEQPLTRRELREREGNREPVRDRPESASFRAAGGDQPPKKRRRLTWLWVLLVILGLGGGAAFGAWTMFEPQIRKVLGWELPIDYEGTGNGEVVEIAIVSGDTGSDISATLFDAGVTMTKNAFYKHLISLDPSPTFQPGTYALQGEMSSAAALAALQDPANHVIDKVLIVEGKTLPQVLQALADGTDIPLEEFQSEAADYVNLGVPASAPSLEGYLFPATYTFQPSWTAHDILSEMVRTMYQKLDAAGVPVEQRHEVLTMAALIQKESGPSDMGKVSRVFWNRIDDGMLLQSDATVRYGAGGTSILTTGAERSDASNIYNTYVHPGLPAGPISAPGEEAIQAALNPVDGPWLYFVLVNGETGESQFSSTLAEHNEGVKKWQAWLREHPDFDN